MGSGTTAVVAKKFGRQFIGFELNRDYVEMANKRLAGVTSTDPIRSPMPHEPQLFAREELVAEMGSAFLCGYTGIENKVIDGSFKAVEYWSRKIQDDPRLLMHASGHALNAVEYILGINQ